MRLLIILTLTFAACDTPINDLAWAPDAGVDAVLPDTPVARDDVLAGPTMLACHADSDCGALSEPCHVAVCEVETGRCVLAFAPAGDRCDDDA